MSERNSGDEAERFPAVFPCPLCGSEIELTEMERRMQSITCPVCSMSIGHEQLDG